MGLQRLAPEDTRRRRAALDMPLMEFDKYVKTHNIFDTSFAASEEGSLPELGGNLGFGKNFGIGNQTSTTACLLQRQQRLPEHGRCLLPKTPRGHRHRAGRLLLRQLCAGQARRLGYPGLHPAPERPHRLHFLLRPQMPSTPTSAAKVLMPKDTS